MSACDCCLDGTTHPRGSVGCRYAPPESPATQAEAVCVCGDGLSNHPSDSHSFVDAEAYYATPSAEPDGEATQATGVQAGSTPGGAAHVSQPPPLTPAQDGAEVEALAGVIQAEFRGASMPDARSAARAVLASGWLAQRDKDRDAAAVPTERLCSQCGERMSAMVKVGTTDGWCTVCLDEAAEGEDWDAAVAAEAWSVGEKDGREAENARWKRLTDSRIPRPPTVLPNPYARAAGDERE